MYIPLSNSQQARYGTNPEKKYNFNLITNRYRNLFITYPFGGPVTVRYIQVLLYNTITLLAVTENIFNYIIYCL